ncbi:MAG: DUF2752 domain-containing protein [Terriglobales bacterium]
MNLESRSAKLALVAVMAAGAAVLYRWNPATAGFFPPCPFFSLTGWYCPGCGSLRALHQLLHGNLGAALDLNPLLVMALPFVAYELVARLLDHPRWRPLPVDRLPAAWARALCATVIAFGVVRNLPQYLFTLLAP